MQQERNKKQDIRETGEGITHQPSVQELGNLSRNEIVTRVNGNTSEDYGYFVRGQSQHIEPINTQRAIDGVNDILASIGAAPVDTLPTIFLVTNNGNGEGVPSPSQPKKKKSAGAQIIDPREGQARAELAPFNRSPRNEEPAEPQTTIIDMGSFTPDTFVELGDGLILTHYEKRPAVINTQTGEAHLPNYRRLSGRAIDGATADVVVPGMVDAIPDDTTRSQYGREIMRRMLVAGSSISDEQAREITAVTPDESAEATLSLTDWARYHFRKNGQEVWKEIARNDIRSENNVPDAMTTPPHMRIGEDQKKLALYSAVKLVAETQKRVFTAIARENGIAEPTYADIAIAEQTAAIETIQQTVAEVMEAQTATEATEIFSTKAPEVKVVPENVSLGSAVVRTDIPSTEGPFRAFAEYKTQYPERVTQELGRLYDTYNQTFCGLIERNREWETDYQQCVVNGRPVNFGVQIDMNGMPQELLKRANELHPDELHGELAKRVFEIENSLAGYTIIGDMFSTQDEKSRFHRNFRQGLEEIKRVHDGKPIVLLAVTDAKYDGMLGFEFGRDPHSIPTDAQVKAISGFDAFWGPKQFAEYARKQRYDDSEVLFYARTSDPVAKLANPNVQVDHPVLSDPDMRRFLKAHTLTMNIDNPEWPEGDPRRINDTKAYLGPMGLAYDINALEDIYSDAFRTYLQSGGKRKDLLEQEVFTADFASFLRRRDIDENLIQTGKVPLRYKPTLGTYGCYGHVFGPVTHGATRKEAARQIRMRAPYVIQPEMIPPQIQDEQTGATYKYIDRDFMMPQFGPNGETTYNFLGGFRTMVRVGSTEEKAHRLHGSEDTYWAEVYGK